MNYKQIEDYQKLDDEHKKLIDYFIKLFLQNQAREEAILTKLCGSMKPLFEEYPPHD